ncbi:MAG: hypothetical protein IJB41_08960, partial [Clostridia bacterium]|nr:hypothetical protein [Clostridia bacterium]
LYRLDQIETTDSSSGTDDLGPLPAAAKALLWALGAAWAGIILYMLSDTLKKRKKSANAGR